jgi:hypothetical protein
VTSSLTPPAPSASSSTPSHSSPSAVAMADALVADSWGFIGDRALQTAAELGIPDALVTGPATLEAVAEATGTLPEVLGRLLRPLVAAGVLGLDEDGRYTPTAVSALLESGHPDTLRPWFRLMYRITFRFMDDPVFTLRTGRPAFEQRFGTTYFGHLAENPEDAAVFHGAMASFTRRTARAVAAATEFRDGGTVADIGGGLGTLTAEILRRNPGVTGTVFDLPDMAGPASAALAEAGLADRAEVRSGDFFTEVPGADTLLLSWILHDWDDERSLALLRNCRAAQEEGDGRLLVVEAILPEQPGEGLASVLDLVMLFGLGGRERTGTEYAELLRRAGYRHVRTVPLEAPGMFVIEASTR